MANGAVGLRRELSRSSGKLGSALSRVNALKAENRAQAESYAKLQEELKALDAGTSTRLREAEGRAAAADARAEVSSAQLRLAADENKELVRQLRKIEEESERARGEAGAAAERATAAERAAAEARAEKAGAVAYADEASARAEEAGARAEEAEARAEEAKARAEEAESRAREAEIKARRLEAEAGQLISDYKASADFKQEVMEGCLDAYARGFEVCKAKVAEALQINVSQLDGISPGGTDEEPADDQSDEEETGPRDP